MIRMAGTTRPSLLDRLRDSTDRHSWEQFFDQYWRLIYAFARECIEKIRIESLRVRLNNTLFDRLPHGDMIRELV